MSEGDKPRRRSSSVATWRGLACLVGLASVVLLGLIYFKGQGWRDVVILIDDSASMMTLDVYRDPKVKEAADALGRMADLSNEEKGDLANVPGATPANRLRLVQTLLARDGSYLRELLTRRKVRLHVYRFASKPQRIADVTNAGEVEGAVKAIQGLRAKPDSTNLTTAITQVLNDFPASSPAAVVVFSDGAVTEGEGLESVAKYADSLRVPLFFVGLGDAHRQKDLHLHDLQAEDTVQVNDRIVFEVKLTAQGFPASGSFPVALYEKGKERPLDTKTVTAGGDARTVKVRLLHRPTEPGERTFVIRTPLVDGETDKENNQVEKTVYVREVKQINVLYVEGYRRYEYHYLKTLLERVKNTRAINLRVLLLDADEYAPMVDPTLIPKFPTPQRKAEIHTAKEDLWSYDVVILGDVDPEQVSAHLKDVAEWVQERGGGLLVLGGERFSPRAYRNTPLKDVLPLDVISDPGEDEDRVDLARLELTPAGRMHPIFRFSPDERDNQEVWNRLSGFYWHADGYRPRRAAEVLATHPTARFGKPGEKLPLILQHFAGAGRCMFVGVSETWRWNWREDQLHYNQFWVQTVRYLARSKVGRIELRLDRQTPYRRGEPIRVVVRFDDEKPPPDRTEVRVNVERTPPGKPAEKVGLPVLTLSRLEGSGTFQGTLTQTPVGEYRFWLSEPAGKPRPQATGRVLIGVEREAEPPRMNEEEMKKAAEISKGRFYTLDGVDRLIDELPAGWW